ncbi:LysR family transcriptional regulator [Loktanella sp. Alg231-35]|uniref:LysR family transcriptional regulator n=1 Tax=Loktanella sp. Alg231-35 TaxID=1922220 RepID=UPI000D553F37|nr:LysR family transcriptional regulator [Loktanella sp. Alg231-35]
MRLNLKQLEAFVWVVDLQSFRRAAERLNTTQPNISARIAGLEQALGVTLMTRDAGSVRLTGKGQELLAHARRVLQATDDLVTAADQKSLIEGTLRLGVTEMIVHTWLHEYLRNLKREYPGLMVELTVDFSVDLEKRLGERALDLALQNEPFSRLATGQLKIGAYPVIWVASPALGLSGRQTLESLAAQPILTHARDTRLYEEIAAHFGPRRDLAPRLVPSSNLAASQIMAIDGMGIAALPAAMVASDLSEGRLIQLSYDWAPEPLDFYARFDAERSSQAVADAAEIAVTTAMAFNH